MTHLEVLVAAGLVTIERRGREHWNHLNPLPLAVVPEAQPPYWAATGRPAFLELRRAVGRKENRVTAPQMIDKGAVNQRALRNHRTDLVAALYGDDTRVIAAAGKG